MRFVALGAFLIWSMCVPVASAQTTTDLGRFILGMSVDEVIAATPDQHWTREAYGDDLISLAGSSVRIGDLGFSPRLDFRHERLDVIRFIAGGPIASPDQCEHVLLATVTALERSLGVFDGARSPGEYSPTPLASQRTPGGSEIRFYQTHDGTSRVGYATQRGARYAEATARSYVYETALHCEIEVALQAPLSDFEPLPPPTMEQREAAREIPAADWAETASIRVYELTFPFVTNGASGRVRLDCLVIEDAKINCAIEQEQPLDLGFGPAALAVSRFYRIEQLVDGVPTAGKRVRLVIRFHGTQPLPPRD